MQIILASKIRFIAKGGNNLPQLQIRTNSKCPDKKKISSEVHESFEERRYHRRSQPCSLQITNEKSLGLERETLTNHLKGI